MDQKWTLPHNTILGNKHKHTIKTLNKQNSLHNCPPAYHWADRAKKVQHEYRQHY